MHHHFRLQNVPTKKDYKSKNEREHQSHKANKKGGISHEYCRQLDNCVQNREFGNPASYL